MVRPADTEMTIMNEEVYSHRSLRNRRPGMPLEGPTWGSPRSDQKAEGARGQWR